MRPVEKCIRIANSLRGRQRGRWRERGWGVCEGDGGSEELQLEVAFLRMLNDLLLKQVRKLTARLETALLA
jgi:hypothetical protein